ncbi:hypothetical protein SISSUDRAFT_1037523 [Sistotremastrum suecicum HHB10207 ss-3]|uniref:Uncharacterized protein n=1 Tax=Sistotremastrum suecicum HHB10207 ss-3 TaxID=1314776 RepID=A0A165Y0X6_9AGAM|nr:hypothetical protein SISSUDRAFT_1037523 [Sistotremastrum suecicum HHB10207 ss-3]
MCDPELPGPHDEELNFMSRAIVHGIAVYKDNKRAATLEEDFLNALAGCVCLLSEGRHDCVKSILKDADHFTLLVILADHRMRSKNIYELVPVIADGNAVECLRKLTPNIIDRSLYLQLVDLGLDFPPVIEILARLVPLLPSTYIVPREFDLSCLISPLQGRGYSGRFQPPYSPWMFGEYFATTIYYLDHGAFDRLADKGSSRSFFDQILRFDEHDPDLWEDEEENWQFTVKRAKYYLEVLDALRAAAAPSQPGPEEVITELPTSDNWRGLARQRLRLIWHGFRGGMGSFWISGHMRKEDKARSGIEV